VTDIFTGANMSRDGVIDCLGYLSMPLSLDQRPPPPNASSSSCLADPCGERLAHDRCVVMAHNNNNAFHFYRTLPSKNLRVPDIWTRASEAMWSIQ